MSHLIKHLMSFGLGDSIDVQVDGCLGFINQFVVKTDCFLDPFNQLLVSIIVATWKADNLVNGPLLGPSNARLLLTEK